MRRTGSARTAIAIREACATIAMAVSHTSSGAAHTVVLMLRNPAFRTQAIDDAMRRTNIYDMQRPTDLDRQEYAEVREAARVLAPHTGKVL